MAKVSGKAAGAGAAVLVLASVVVMRWEGIEYKPYPDPATGGAPWTVCFGHTGPDVVRGKSYSRAECDALLESDLAVAQGQVRRCVGRPMPERVEAALVSLVFNVGASPVCKEGRTLRRVAREGNWPAVCVALEQYKFAGGRVYRGLVRRRADERAMCEGRA